MGFTLGVKNRDVFMEEALEGMKALKNDQRRGAGWEALQAERPGQRRWWKVVVVGRSSGKYWEIQLRKVAWRNGWRT